LNLSGYSDDEVEMEVIEADELPGTHHLSDPAQADYNPSSHIGNKNTFILFADGM